jgi:hypothetical protein
MTNPFNFDISQTWEENLTRLLAYLEGQDLECAKLLFDNLATLMVDDGTTGRRDFNQIILASLNALAEAEIAGSTT